MDNNEAVKLAADEAGVLLIGGDPAALKRQLVDKINDLLVNDFDKLISILYRMDVSENKLKHLLKENPAQDAALIIASLMIERQMQKIESRKRFKQPGNDIDENEKW